MHYSRLLQKVNVTFDRSIMLGKYVVCDAFQKDKPLTVYSHIHSDHMIGFATALGAIGTEIIVSIPTRDLLVALEGTHLLRYTNLKAVNWAIPYRCADETLTLFKAEHILGSSQVLVEDEEGYRLVYTSDFNNDTQPIEADALIIDATYGNVHHHYSSKELLDELLHLIKRELHKNKPVYIFTRRGRLQRLMLHLREEGVTVPFITKPEETRIAKVYERYYKNIGEYFSDDTIEAWELMRKEDPYVAFYILGTKVPLSEKYLKVEVTAYGAQFPLYMKEKKNYVVAISDHADLDGILNYVQKSSPKLVITDASRSGENAVQLAQIIKNRLNIEAKALP